MNFCSKFVNIFAAQGATQISQHRYHNTGGKLTTGVIDINSKFTPGAPPVIISFSRFILVLVTSSVNSPPVSTTPVSTKSTVTDSLNLKSIYKCKLLSTDCVFTNL
jgi:hypothetical protein